MVSEGVGVGWCQDPIRVLITPHYLTIRRTLLDLGHTQTKEPNKHYPHPAQSFPIDRQYPNPLCDTILLSPSSSLIVIASATLRHTTIAFGLDFEEVREREPLTEPSELIPIKGRPLSLIEESPRSLGVLPCLVFILL